jgi:hypothetical protein
MKSIKIAYPIEGLPVNVISYNAQQKSHQASETLVSFSLKKASETEE